MSQQIGSSNIKTLTILLASVLVFSGVGAYLASAIRQGHEPRDTTHQTESESARIAPIGAVATDAVTGPGEAPAAATVIVQTVIEKPPIDAEALYKSVCFACHETGAADAPKLVAEAWVDRLAKGEEALAAAAVNGIGMMPPKGGRMDLSDDEVTAVVGYMISKVQE